METTVLKKKELGQFYTPITVVDFILDTVKVIGGSRLGNTPRLIDPACGEGVFLIQAIQKEIGVPSTMVGVDIDKQIKDAWEVSGLSRILNGNLFVQNGLYDTADGTVSEKCKGGLFDVVVGNPPYGGIGLANVEKDRKLFNALKTYELWKLGTRRKGQDDQGNLFRKDVLDNLKRLTKVEIEQLERFPIEVLFLERFVRLAKPAGVIGIIIPDGILANVNYGYVRDWISERCHVVAIVSLPRNVFRGTGTTAKTSILFLQKKGPGAKPRKKVFMAQIDEDDINLDGGKAAFDFVRDKLRTDFQGRTSNSPRIWTDITHGDLGGGVRWDADYYDPKYRVPIEKMRSKFETVRFEDLFENSVSGYRGKTEFAPDGIRCIEARCVREPGLDIKEGRFVPEGGKFDSPNRRIEQGDILMVRSGVGCAGRVVCVTEIPGKITIGGHIYKINVNDILLPTYIAVFLKSFLGWLQIDRERSGTGALVLDVVAIKDLRIPIMEYRKQITVDKLYKSAYRNHSRAMERKWEIIEACGEQPDRFETDKEFRKLINKATENLDKAIKSVEGEISI